MGADWGTPRLGLRGSVTHAVQWLEYPCSRCQRHPGALSVVLPVASPQPHGTHARGTQWRKVSRCAEVSCGGSLAAKLALVARSG